MFSEIKKKKKKQVVKGSVPNGKFSGPLNMYKYNKDDPKNWYGRKKRCGPGKESGEEK